MSKYLVNYDNFIRALAISTDGTESWKIATQDLHFELDVLGIHQFEDASISFLQIVVDHKFLPSFAKSLEALVATVHDLPRPASVG